MRRRIQSFVIIINNLTHLPMDGLVCVIVIYAIAVLSSDVKVAPLLCGWIYYLARPEQHLLIDALYSRQKHKRLDDQTSGALWNWPVLLSIDDSRCHLKTRT